jgi:endonuclease/exonuclease/phosphatase family metal-dependent hydrolase
MRLLSYNIHKGAGNDRRYRFERIIRVIEEAAPDVICLQEVDYNARRTQFDDQPRLLVEHFKPASFAYQLNHPHHDGGYGNLILSRWPFVAQNELSLRMRKMKNRGAQLVVVATPSGPLHIINWHLGLRERERRWQVNYLLHHPLFHSSGHLPTIIVGDYNDWRNTLEGRVFARHHFVQATAPLRQFRSFPSFLAMTALDKLFYRGEVTIREARVLRSPLARRASDHLPLVAELQLVPAQRKVAHHPHPSEMQASGKVIHMHSPSEC